MRQLLVGFFVAAILFTIFSFSGTTIIKHDPIHRVTDSVRPDAPQPCQPSQAQPQPLEAFSEDLSEFYDDLTMVNFPKKAPTLKELAMCQKMFYGGPAGWGPDCEDPTCWDCLAPRAQEVVNNMTEVMKKTSLVESRRALISKYFAGVDKAKEPVILMITDSNFGNYSLNMACSCEANNIQMKHRTLWVSVDKESYHYFTEMGLFALESEEHYGLVPDTSDAWKTKVYRQAAKSVLTMVLDDLLQLGFNIIFNDADVVWLRDPSAWLMSSSYSANMDIQLSIAPRGDAMGPGNSGFIFIRNNAKTKLFMESFKQAIALLFFRDDQKVWNSMLRHYLFRQLHFQVLPRNLVLDFHDSTANLRNEHTFILHAVGAKGKYGRMNQHKIWYLKQGCSFLLEGNPLQGTIDTTIL